MYTAWRKLIGTEYDTRVNVFLIDDDHLITLDNREIDFNSFKRSNKVIHNKYLAKFRV